MGRPSISLLGPAKIHAHGWLYGIVPWSFRCGKSPALVLLLLGCWALSLGLVASLEKGGSQAGVGGECVAQVDTYYALRWRQCRAIHCHAMAALYCCQLHAAHVTWSSGCHCALMLLGVLYPPQHLLCCAMCCIAESTKDTTAGPDSQHSLCYDSTAQQGQSIS